jgi:hypothetical protein
LRKLLPFALLGLDTDNERRSPDFSALTGAVEIYEAARRVGWGCTTTYGTPTA